MLNRDIIEKEILSLEQHDTTYATCERLAPLYIVRANLTGQQQKQRKMLSVEADSEFLQAINGKDSVKVWTVIDDLMDTLKAVYPQVYKSTIKNINEI